MSTYTIHDKHFGVRIPAEEIRQAVEREAQKIALQYKDLRPLFVVVLKGAMFFAADLIRATNIHCSVEAISARSYGNQMESSGMVTLVNAMPEVRGRHVILIEDIVDTGLTLFTIIEALKDQKPESIAIAACISKPAMHKVTLDVSFCCFEMESEFLIGYGLDYAEHGRELSDIYELLDVANP